MQRSQSKLVAGLVLALSLALPLGAQQGAGSPVLVLVDDPAPLLGMGLQEAWSFFGPPLKVSALRGDAAWQDDVVFSYAPGYSLSWAGDRLWQIRFGQGYAGSVYGVFIGDDAGKLVSLLGTPFFSSEASYVFRMAWKGYPVRMRAVIIQGKVSELFVYRADF